MPDPSPAPPQTNNDLVVMSYNQSVDASAMMANDTQRLLSLSNEILNQIIDNLDLTPASEDTTTAICLALTSRRLYTIVLNVSVSRDLINIATTSLIETVATIRR